MTAPGGIVMVDDNDAELLLAAECFAMSRLDCAWTTFHSGVEFLGYLERVRAGQVPTPSCVLLDINMPRKDGFQVLQEVRSGAKTSFRVIMLTNSVNPKDEATAFELGADGFQIKPESIGPYIEFFNGLAEPPR